MIMPHSELYSSTGKKIHSWLKTNTDVANNLWRCNLLKIVQQSYSPHCPSCTCTRSHPPPTRPIDLEDIRTLRVVKLNPILTQDDVLIRDSLNGLSVRPSPMVLNSMPLEVGLSYQTPSSHEEATHVSSSVQERTVRYRSPTSPVAQAPKYATAASQCSPPISKKDAKKKKKAKKQKREKSMTPDSTCGPSKNCGRSDPWPIHRSRSPPRASPRSRAAGRQSSPKRIFVERRRSPAPSPESRSPTPPRVIQVTRERRKSSPEALPGERAPQDGG